MTTDTTAEVQAARSRLGRLESFLVEDPHNQSLLTDAFETALSCKEWARADMVLAQGLASGVEPWSWRLKQADWLLAQYRYGEARAALLALQQEAEAPPTMGAVLAHNLSFIDVQEGAFHDSVTRLASWMELGHVDVAAEAATDAAADPTLKQALQTLWLRSLHRTGELDRAMAWTRAADAAHTLSPQAAGVAGQIALDADDLAMAERWTALSLEQGQPTLESLTTAASLALGQSDAEATRKWCTAALQLKPDDGRARSVMGFGDMLAGDMPQAEQSFRQALQTSMAEHIGTWHGLALSLVLQGRLDEAQALYEQTLEMDRNFAESHGGLAVVLALKQQPELAQQSLDRALGLDKRSLSAAYAQALLAPGGMEKSQTLLRQFLRKSGVRVRPFKQ
jgi:tetratricopeptide (TPR) repeat protein